MTGNAYRFLDEGDESIAFRLESLWVSYHTAVSAKREIVSEALITGKIKRKKKDECKSLEANVSRGASAAAAADDERCTRIDLIAYTHTACVCVLEGTNQQRADDEKKEICPPPPSSNSLFLLLPFFALPFSHEGELKGERVTSARQPNLPPSAKRNVVRLANFTLRPRPSTRHFYSFSLYVIRERERDREINRFL